MIERGLYDSLMISISRERLEAYRRDGDDDLATIANYFWNIELSEALYPILQAFEIALRNSIHASLTSHFGDPFWFDQPGFLLDWQADAVSNAKEVLDKRKRPRDPGRIVAELHFGFWHSMFNRPYEDQIWHTNQAEILRQVFPHMPRTMRTRKNVWNRVDRIRRLRNRVFHYEPVWANAGLKDEVLAIHELLAMISPPLEAVVALSERFSRILDDGSPRTKSKLIGLLDLPQ
ncbi:MAG: hypothetical protein QM753_16825 [Thermomicrobiales bacterium]